MLLFLDMLQEKAFDFILKIDVIVPYWSSKPPLSLGMIKMKYFLRLLTGDWEEVTQTLYEQRKYVVDLLTDKPCYTGESILVENDRELLIDAKVSYEELGKILRFFNISSNMGVFKPIVKEIDSAAPRKIVRGNSRKLYIAQTDQIISYQEPKKLDIAA